MKKLIWLALLLGAITVQAEVTNSPALSLALDLKDGSRLVGAPRDGVLSVMTGFGSVDLPLASLRGIELAAGPERATCRMRNGDVINGSLQARTIRLATLFGNVSVDLAQVKALQVSSFVAGRLPAGEGPLEFCGYRWTPLRREFSVQGDRLAPGGPRPGFDYGHSGNGRDAVVVCNVGSEAWRDYVFEFDLAMTGVDPEFNSYGLPRDFQRANIIFRVSEFQENWNRPSSSCYCLALDGNGSWSLGSSCHQYFTPERGFGPAHDEGGRTMASGRGLKVDREKGNHVKVAVVGRNIQIWFDGGKIVDMADDGPGLRAADVWLNHGGVGFAWPWEGAGWVRNFSARGR